MKKLFWIIEHFSEDNGFQNLKKSLEKYNFYVHYLTYVKKTLHN